MSEYGLGYNQLNKDEQRAYNIFENAINYLFSIKNISLAVKKQPDGKPSGVFCLKLKSEIVKIIIC